MQTILQATQAAMADLSKAATTTRLAADAWRPTLDLHDGSLRVAAEACAQFIAEMEAGGVPRWLTLNGEAGCGKTMLARQVFNRSIPSNPGNAPLWVDEGQRPGLPAKRRPRCVWLDASEMAERMRAKEFDLPEYLADDFLVVLDDLGAVRDKTDFMADAVYRLCQQRRDKWTVFTSNLTLAEISAQVDERVASRLIRDRNIQVRITAGDYALRRTKATPPVGEKGAVLAEGYVEAPGWQAWLKSKYPDESWADTAAALQWQRLPEIWRAKISREFR